MGLTGAITVSKTLKFSKEPPSSAVVHLVLKRVATTGRQFSFDGRALAQRMVGPTTGQERSLRMSWPPQESDRRNPGEQKQTPDVNSGPETGAIPDVGRR
jgi:hypothetical protein